MTQLDVDRYRTQLLQLRERLTGEIGRLSEAVLSDAQPVGEHDHTVSEAVDKEVVLEQTEEQIRREVSAALRRITEGTYGKCEACGRPIPLKRLNALPYTRYCVDCEQKAEAK